MSLAPICLFTYNRLDETRQTVESLKRNNLAAQSDLILFSDGWKKEEDREKIIAVRNYLDTITGFKKTIVIAGTGNKGLAQSIIEGVTETLLKYDKVIVLEDDLITTENFLDFMNQALDFYKTSEVIQSISGFSLKIKSKPKNTDVFFQKRAHSWGWATWSNRWDEKIFDKENIRQDIENDSKLLLDFRKACGNDIDRMLIDSLDGKNDSWYVRWCLDHFKEGKLAVYPVLSKVSNIGFSDEGTHCKAVNVFECEIDNSISTNFNFSKKFDNPTVDREFLNYFTKKHKFKYRLKLLKSPSGIKELANDLKHKFLPS